MWLCILHLHQWYVMVPVPSNPSSHWLWRVVLNFSYSNSCVGFPDGSESKESACNEGDLGSTPGLGRSPGGRHDNPLKYSCLENPHGQKSLEGYSPWGCKESDTTEVTQCVHTCAHRHICILNFSVLKTWAILHSCFPFPRQ